MPTAPFIWPISARAAKVILTERRITMAEFNKTGRLDLSVDTRLTKTGRCQWQIVDLCDVGGKNLKPHLTPQQQQKLPAVQEEMEAPTFEKNEGDREEVARNHRNLQTLRAS